MTENKRPILFILRTFNDTDHIAPLIWKLQTTGRAVRVILADINANLDLRNEWLLNFLTSSGVSIEYYYAIRENWIRFPNRLLGSPTNPIAVKLLRHFFRVSLYFVWTRHWADCIIKKINPAALVVDSHGPDESSVEGRLIFACKRAHVPVVCVSHGPNVLINFNPDEEGLRRPQKKEKIALPEYGIFDLIVAQTPYELRHWKEQGFDMQKLVVLGSSRYCPEWLSINKNIWPSFFTKKNASGRKKILFFLPHWRPYTDQRATLELIEALAARSDFFVVIKEHTREGAGSLPEDLRARYRTKANTELIESAKSVSFERWIASGLKSAKEMFFADSSPLVDWADAVICFNSSVGMEALCKRKPLLNPAYLCDYSTFYEALGAGTTVYSRDEFFEELDKVLGERDPDVNRVDRFNKEIIFANLGEHDVLGRYVDLISEVSKS